MHCPKCGFDQPADFSECPRCGVVLARFRPVTAGGPGVEGSQPSPELLADLARITAARAALRRELTARAVALPSALVLAWLSVRGAPGAVRMLAMWVHESGHAAAAWLCGYLAWPGPWFTPVGTEPSRLLTLTLVGLLGYGAWQARERQRPFWLVAASTTLLLVLACTFGLHPGQAQQFIVFAGDGGCFVLGTCLMLTVFAREEHPIRREHLRWAFLAIGALAFMDAYATWSGGIAAVPFGANDHGLSDPSVLAEEFGWSVLTLMRRYLQLAHACLAVLAAVAVVQILLPALALRSSDQT